MARGVSQQAQNQATQTEQMATAQQQQNQQLQQRNQGQLNSLLGSYNSILANPGYTPAQQNAITQSTMGSLGATYDALQNSAKMNAARTRNDAGQTALLDDLARSHGEDAANLAAKNQTNFANNAQQQQEMALSGMSKLYGVNTDLLGKSLGLPVSYFNAANSSLGVANQPSPWQQTLTGITGGLVGGVGKGLGTLIGKA